MKNMKKVIASAVVLLALGKGVSAQSTAYGSTTATLVTPLSIQKTTDMDFGTVAATGNEGIVYLDYNNSRLSDGGAYLPAGSTAQKAAVFTVTGEATTAFTIEVPAASITLSDGASHSLSVDNFECDLGTSSALVGGTKVLKVRAQLHVTANAVGGVYKHDALDATGLYVKVNYN